MSSNLAFAPTQAEPVRRALPALPSLSLPRSLLLALLIEGALLIGVAELIAHAKSHATAEQPVTLVFDDSRPEPPKKEEPKPEPPKPIEKPTPVKRVIVQPQPTPLPPPPVVQPTPAPSPIAEQVVPPAPPPPPVQAPSNDVLQKEADFAARLRAAIQAAVVYPFAARTMGFQGKARIEFVFHDGAFSHVRVIQGSGNGMIDQAALAAVTNAAVPLIPESLKGKSMSYQVTVMFQLNAS